TGPRSCGGPGKSRREASAPARWGMRRCWGQPSPGSGKLKRNRPLPTGKALLIITDNPNATIHARSGGVEYHPVAPFALGPVKRDVRPLDQRLGRIGRALVERR